jgi:hypothetical protein
MPMSKDKEILDIRGMSYREKVRALRDQYQNAYDVWKNYDNVDPRLKETFKSLAEMLNDYDSELDREI